MDLNVCSRRVHDGYATIRSRGGRTRPRAVYRSDSEELLKDVGGPYAVPKVTNFPIASEHGHQIPRWSDLGKDHMCENYGTLQKSSKRNGNTGNTPKSEKISLNTFAKVDDKPDCRRDKKNIVVLNSFSADATSKVQNGPQNEPRNTTDNLNTFRKKGTKHKNQNERIRSKDDLVYDTVSPEVSTLVTFSGGKLQDKVVEDRLYDTVPFENVVLEEREADQDGNKTITLQKEISQDMVETFKEEIKSRLGEMVESHRRTNGVKERQPIYAVPNVSSRTKTDRVVVIDGNYVPSGDLYRTTAKYIEDINRNIAEIDKSYDELRSSNNRTASSNYGIINKIAKGDIPDRSQTENEIYKLRKKRDMAPMLPISANFGEIIDEKFASETLDVKRRPNSYGKLPPKIFPRSSSIDNTTRHSTGSTTSSTKSTESLYAISESLTDLPKNKQRIYNNVNCTKKLLHVQSRDDLSSTDDDKSVEMSLERLPTARRNRSTENSAVRKDRSRRSHQSMDRSGNRQNRDEERKYGTLPYRRTKGSSRPLHKSSEDVLDGERLPHGDSKLLQRSCMSTIDVRSRSDSGVSNDFDEVLGKTSVPLHLMDATDIILKGQLERSRSFLQKQMDAGTAERLRARGTTRTRHNSLESEDEGGRYNPAFATLPRRGNISKDHHANNDPTPKRLSGNVPILEPLYEHAVSDPVKPRNTEHVIPWWELATRKYRHQSCPSLQAHVVSAFEQSLHNMTQRLQQLTATAEKKDSELQELKDTIERLRKQSAEAGLNNGTTNGRRHTLGDSDSATTGCTGNSNHQGSSMARQLSADSVTSLNSLSSACSASSHHKRKGWFRSSLSKAFSKSRKNRHGSVSDAEDCKDGPTGELSAPNSPRLPTAAKHESSSQESKGNGQKSPEHENPLSGSKSSSALYKKEEDEDVDELKKQLREKDLVLTDIRLEALSSAHQLESLKDTVIKMRNEMLNLKQNNERLQRLVTSKSLTSSQSSLPSDPERRFSMTEVASSVAVLSNGDSTSTADQLEDLNVPEHPVVPSTTSTTSEPVIEQDTDGKRINVAVYLGSEKSFNYNLGPGNNSDNSAGEPPHCVIASVCISNKTTWDALDSTVRRCFNDYVSRVDPVTNLGLGVDPATNLGLGVECVVAYHLGEASRCITDSQHPELLPCGYLVGHVKTIYLVLSGYSWLAVDTLIPRLIVQRLVSLLTEHRRVILCGPSGTGKSYLAGKLAHALVDDNDIKDAAAVATFNVDHKSSKELRQYLAHIAERCDSNAADELPRVIILENLQHAASLGELFSGLLGTRHSSCPAIIGTMSQTTCNTTNLQLHHNFRWVLCANHMEPVKGFLGRYLRRKLLEHELRESGGSRNAEMAAVVEWLPRVWLHLNKFLETYCSSDVTIGPRLFLSCPMEVAGSQVWFTDLWNYSVIPYLVEAVREGLTLYGRRDSGWEDPAQFITSSYPWISTHAVHGGSDALLRLRPEDVGYDVVSSGHTSGVGTSSVKSLGSTHSDTEGDPLLNMLMRLQEAANYSSPHGNDSDSVTSHDSSHNRHSEDLGSSTSSSRGVESAL